MQCIKERKNTNNRSLSSSGWGKVSQKTSCVNKSKAEACLEICRWYSFFLFFALALKDFFFKKILVLMKCKGLFIDYYYFLTYLRAREGFAFLEPLVKEKSSICTRL